VFAAGNALSKTLTAKELHTKYSNENCKWAQWKRNARKATREQKLTGDQSMRQEPGKPGDHTKPFIITHTRAV
jgi:hypothetical protein